MIDFSILQRLQNYLSADKVWARYTVSGYIMNTIITLYVIDTNLYFEYSAQPYMKLKFWSFPLC